MHRGAGVGPEGPTIEGYRVIRELGRGATAVVWLVQRDMDGRRFALKVPTEDAHLGRAEIEAILGRILDHPNLVPVVDILKVGGATALLMEHVDGPSLRGWLDENRSDPRLALALAHGIISGLAHCHDLGLIHRDLTPANILLETAPDGQLIPRITDFGLAKARVLQGQTLIGTAMGTPDYAAPEQLRDASSVDHRADVYSLGCILYELFTGERLFQDMDLYDRLVASKKPPAPELHRRAPDLAPDLVELIRQMLASDPEARPSALGRVRAQLEEHMPWIRPVAPTAEPSPALILGGLVALAFAVVLVTGLAGALLP